MFKHELGIKVKDKITGFKGIVMGRAQYLTGCNTYAVSPTKLTKEGKRPDWEWFDEDRVEVISKKISLKADRTRGFDGTHPERD